jgi:hypothetical protein
VALDLAVPTDDDVLLDLHEGANLGVVSDPAAVEIDEIVELHVLAEFNVGGYFSVHGDISDPLAGVFDV